MHELKGVKVLEPQKLLLAAIFDHIGFFSEPFDHIFTCNNSYFLQFHLVPLGAITHFTFNSTLHQFPVSCLYCNCS